MLDTKILIATVTIKALPRFDAPCSPVRHLAGDDMRDFEAEDWLIRLKKLYPDIAIKEVVAYRKGFRVTFGDDETLSLQDFQRKFYKVKKKEI
ncbi:hypothetical protein [Serratia entomophila]|uniref:hypothetical protein n=1 Tax=Serratia entomophila TaxID=42906 RepID=UPI0021BB51E5|nr:hypothetical protein [Serratia entomophila]